MRNRKSLHWSHYIPTWYWVLVLLPIGVVVSIAMIMSIMLFIVEVF